MLYCDRVDISEGVDPTKSNGSRECMIYHYFFFNRGFKFQDYVCNGFNDLTMLSVNMSDIVIISVKNVDSKIKFVSKCFLTQEMCGKIVNTYFFVFDSIPDWCKTQEVCDRVASEDPFLIVYCPDKYKTQKMCDEAVDKSLATLKLTPD